MTGIRGSIAVAAILFALPLPAAQHLIDINEVYSNADGSVQYIELITTFGFQSALASTSLVAVSADGSMSNTIFDFTATYPPFSGSGTDGLTVLIATAGFEAEFGFAPDFIMPDNSLPSPDGRLVFFKESGACSAVGMCPSGSMSNCEIDAVAYGAYTGSNGVYGTPTIALPRDGCLSLTRTSSSNCNDLAFEALPPTPTRTDGTEGGIICDQQIIRGDVNGDGTFNALQDTLILLAFGFVVGSPAPPCEEAADCDGSGAVNALVDSLYNLNHGFQGGPPPPAPYPDCGIATGSLPCDDYFGC